MGMNLNLELRRSLGFALAAVFLSACGARQETASALDALGELMEEQSELEDCDLTEFSAAQLLFERAQDAREAGDWRDAARLAEAARVQLAEAQEIMENQPERCRNYEAPIEQVETEEAPEQDEPVEVVEVESEYAFVTVFFEFNRSSLSEAARNILSAHASELLEDEGLRIVVEGHCDDRGSSAYNLALGDRRARSVRDYLVRLGVEESRISTVSYGHEMPAGSNWDDNRRAEFRTR